MRQEDYVVWDTDVQQKNISREKNRNISADKYEYCRYCDARISRSDRYCFYCGAKQSHEKHGDRTYWDTSQTWPEYDQVNVGSKRTKRTKLAKGTRNYNYYPAAQYYTDNRPNYSYDRDYDQNYVDHYKDDQYFYSPRTHSKIKTKKRKTAAKIISILLIFSFIGTAGLAVLATNAPSDTTNSVSKYALVIGVEEYVDPFQRDLEIAKINADAWEEYLEDHGYLVNKLLDGKKDEILEALDDLEEKENKGDYVAFIFIGHGAHDGYTGNDGRWHNEEGHSYLCAADSSDDHIGKISDTELVETFEGFDSEHIFIFLESCFSGGFNELGGAGRVLTLACGENTPTCAAWTYYFLGEGLAKSKYKDCETVFENVKDDMYNFVYDKYLRHPNWIWEPPTPPNLIDGDPDEPFIL